ncbi:MAG TPA: endonuclease/exonuclease/phosphatase family protein [Phycisphaerae bacterium]|nr:endonuclease/exonuclease/phosphatase family protein [Phycisphaerae bacterium]
MPRGIPSILFILLIVALLGLWAWSVSASHAPAAAPTALTLPAPDSSRLTVITANIRISEPDDGPNAWPNRRELLVKTLLKYNPDVIGCQEVSPAQGAFLIKEFAPWFTHYPRAGVGTIEGEGSANNSGTSQLLGEVTASFASLDTLFYRSDRFDQIDGTAGLVLPDQPQANPSENTFFTQAVLKQKSDGKLLIVINTHLRHQQQFAVNCALKLRKNLAAALKKYPGADCLLMGDINFDRTEAPCRALVGDPNALDGLGLLSDTFDYAHMQPNQLYGNWHAFTGFPQRRLPTDLIFTSPGWKSQQTTEIRDAGPHGLWPSDHFFTLSQLSRP